MGHELCYSVMIPNEWLRARTVNNVSNIIFQHVSQRVLNDERLEEVEVTIDSVTAMLNISNQCLTWCFVKINANEINDAEYTRINNWISGLFCKIVNFHVQRRALVVMVANVNIIEDDEGFMDDFSEDE